jgi:hypothetical protein
MNWSYSCGKAVTAFNAMARRDGRQLATSATAPSMMAMAAKV